MATWSLTSSASATSATSGQLLLSRLVMVALAQGVAGVTGWPYVLLVSGEIGRIPYLSIPTNFASTAWVVSSALALLNPR